MSQNPEAPTMDVHHLPCSKKLPLIFEAYDRLAVGESFILRNDIDPVPLNRKFETLYGGAYAWEYLERGPAFWQVKIAKI